MDGQTRVAPEAIAETRRLAGDRGALSVAAIADDAIARALAVCPDVDLVASALAMHPHPEWLRRLVLTAS